MTDEIVERAAYNNALWCDAVCATHRGGGAFRESFWLNCLGAPRFYPDLATLRGSKSAVAQTEAISALIQTPRQEDYFVKDSFHSLDLGRYGFDPFADAEWLSAAPLGPSESRTREDAPWRRIGAEDDLLCWEQAWAKVDPNPDKGRSRMFMPRLLSASDIHFISVIVDGAPKGGGVLNAGAGVVGLSNLFACGIDLEAVWRALADAARAVFPHAPLVTYDHGEALAAAHRAGFTTVGNLRIWRRAGS